VIKNLTFDLILGLDFLKQTQASKDVETDQLILRKAKLTVPLVEAAQRHASQRRSQCAEQTSNDI
jgi:hypothetical protein